MGKYILKRILMMIPVLFGVSVLVFLIQAFTPGDPADLVLGAQQSEETKYVWREKYDLNDNIVVQYGKYMYRLITKGDFGTSYISGTSVNSDLARRLPISLTLAALATLVAALIGVPLGILSAKYRGKWIDALCRVISIIGISLPIFWFAFLAIMLFAVNLRWLPVSGLMTPKHWIMPVLVTGILSSASIMRITRSSVLDNISQDFVRTARAKGQKESKIMSHHILRNSMINIANIIGAQFGNNLGGTAVIETCFVITGLGTMMVSAINNRDYTSLRASVLVVALAISIINLIVDLSFCLIDPRVKAQYTTGKKKKKTAQKAA